ncbi:MAG: T9SS type A sorting domain-containing protein, partial [Flavipsychrobacter sp.]
KDTITFTPKQAWQYVWIEVAALGGDPFEVDVDDVKMLVSGTDVAGIREAGALQILPNPFTGQALLKVNNNVSYPYNVVLYDITGRVVLERKDNNQDNLIIDRPDAGTGIYLLKITDNQQRVYTSKLLVQ